MFSSLKKRGKKFIIFPCLILLLLLPCSGISKSASKISNYSLMKRGMLGVQIPLIESRDFAGFEKKLISFKELGIDTLIVRVFQNREDRNHRLVKTDKKTGVYFKSSYAPCIEDILGDLVRIAHKHHIRIYAWMSTRSCDWLTIENKDLRDSLYDFDKKEILQSLRLNLFNKGAREYLKGLYADLARYDIDGILLQDDLIMRHNESFSKEAREKFFKRFGYTLSPEKMYKEIHRDKKGKINGYSYSEEFWVWSEWKAGYIKGFLNELIKETQKINPDLKFIINLYYETISDPENARAWLSQDIEVIKGPDISYYAIMSYQRQIMRELNLSYPEVKVFLKNLTENAIERIGDSQKILFKIQVMDWGKKERISPEEIREIVHIFQSSGAINLLFFPDISMRTLKIQRKM